MKIKINNKIEVEVKNCRGIQKFSGLMFTKKENAKALLFDFKKPVNYMFHSLFVFFEFVAVWLDDKNKVIDVRLISPWKFNITPKKPFNKVIEIPLNSRYKKIAGSLMNYRRKSQKV